MSGGSSETVLKELITKIDKPIRETLLKKIPTAEKGITKAQWLKLTEGFGQ